LQYQTLSDSANSDMKRTAVTDRTSYGHNTRINATAPTGQSFGDKQNERSSRHRRRIDMIYDLLATLASAGLHILGEPMLDLTLVLVRRGPHSIVAENKKHLIA
jgi:hypothetical protein